MLVHCNPTVREKLEQDELARRVRAHTRVLRHLLAGRRAAKRKRVKVIRLTLST